LCAAVVGGINYPGSSCPLDGAWNDVASMKTFVSGRGQGLTLVHYSAQHEHILWDTLGAWFSPSLLDRGTGRGVTNTA
jgi:hypothetical protein